MTCSFPPPKRPPHAYAGVTPSKLKYARWFIAAGWRIGSVAWLFDVEPEDLLEALDLPAMAKGPV